MSAFILSDKHFSVIAYYIGNLTDIDPQIIADKLKAINIESVNYRYKEKTPKRKCKLMHTGDNYSTADIIRLIRCWSYQSCENGLSLDYQTMDVFLLSFFETDDILDSRLHSDKWSID
jgi:hypothetical protein